MEYVLGLDAGQTKTIVLVARTDGTIIGAARTGCGDIYVNPNLENVNEALTLALADAELPADAIHAAGFSMAGADWPEDIDYLRDSMQRRFACRVTVVNDSIGALRIGSPARAGVAVVCGTGTATGAQSADGRIWHTSFWQEPGGGLDLAQKMLQAIYRAELGIDPPTALTQPALDYCEVSSVEEMLYRFTARKAKRPANRGKLARLLLNQAELGDATAIRIVKEHGASLGDYALAAARKVDIEGMAFNLVLAGSVLRHPSPLLANSLIARVRSTSPQISPVYNSLHPVVGALFLAFDLLGVLTDQTLQANLAQTMPEASLFET